MKKFLKISLIIAICLSIVASLSVSAVSTKYAPYLGYEYNSYNESTAAPIGYTTSDTITGEDFDFSVEAESFTDICVDTHNPDYPSFFILDGTNGVVYKTDYSLNAKAIFDNFTDSKGKNISLKGSTYVACDFSDSYFYVYNNDKIYVISSLSRVIKTIDASGVVSLSSYHTGTDSYLLAVTSDNKGSVSVYTKTGKYIDSFEVGQSLNDISFNYDVMPPSHQLLAIDGGANTVIGLSLVTDFDADGNETISGINVDGSYELGVDLTDATSIATNSFGDTYYIALSDNRIAKYDSMMGESTYIDNSSIPKNVAAPSFKFIAISITDDDDIIALSNDKGPQATIFNSKGGYVGTENSMGISLKSPTDMLYKDGKYVYILDSGNSRIVKLDKNLTKVIDIFANFYNADTDEYMSFYNAMGFTVDDNENFYIADTENYRVFRSDNKGNVNLVILRPDEQLQDMEDAPFSTTKVMLDRKGQIYIICDSINLGAFVYNQEGEFQNYFGANTVQATADVLINYVRKRFMTREQLKALKKSTPITLTNFDIDDQGFVYTVTKTDQSKRNTSFGGMLRKLNYQGDNVFALSENSSGFGDFEWDRQSTSIRNTSFCDVDIDKEGYINLIDSGRGKIFQYSEDGDLITVFGGFSNQTGTFVDPVAIESVDSHIYVLDKSDNSISIFDPTPYTIAMRKAYALLDSSDADSALVAWQEVLKYNTNSQFPYYGMGRAYEMKEDYENAMKYFKLANAKHEYSKSYKEYRKDYVAENIWWMALIAIAVIVVIVIAVKFLKKRMVAKHGEAYSPLETKWGMPIYVLLHPVDGFEQFRTRNIQSIPIAFGLVICWFLVKVFEFFNTGFAYNNNRPIDYDLFANMIATIGLYALFVIANWAVCTLLNGKGRMREILCVTGYALTPIIITTLVSVVLSNSLTLDESAFVTIVTTLGLLWAAVILLLGLYTIHQYSFAGTIGSVLLTVLGMAVLALLIILFFTLLNQCYSFFYSVYSELKLR